MTTDAKTLANARNATRSTGPRTPAGKARSSTNALRHGLCATAVVIRGENAAELEALAERMRADLGPVGELEERLVERVVGLVWRLRRLGMIEAGVFERYRIEGVHRLGAFLADEWKSKVATDSRAVLGDAFAAAADALGTLSRYEAGLDRSLYAALHELQRLQAARSGEPVRVPAALDVTVTSGEEAA